MNSEKQNQKIKKALRSGSAPPIELGFDYAKAIRMLIENGYDARKIASFMGFTNPSGKTSTSIRKILSGATPHHIAGEALYVAVVAVFGRECVKRQLNTEQQRNGEPDSVVMSHLGARKVKLM